MKAFDPGASLPSGSVTPLIPPAVPGGHFAAAPEALDAVGGGKGSVFLFGFASFW